MKALFLICTTLLCSSFIVLSMAIDRSLFYQRDNLKLFLDWCHKYSDVFELQKQKYMVELNSEEDIVIKAAQIYKAQKISNLLYATTQLRNVLVKEDNDYMISDQLESNAETLAAYMGIMSFVLDDLKKNIEEWQEEEDKCSKSLTVMDEKPLKWFKEHGFDESTLNDITLPLLKEKVEELCGDRKPFDSMLSFFGTLHTLIYTADLGSKLAWLYTVGSNPKALYSLENYLRRECRTVLPDTAAKIIEYLRKLGDKEGPLSKIFGNGRDGGLYPCIMPMLNKALFFDARGEQYMKVLVNICSNISIQLDDFEDFLRINGRIVAPNYYLECGFLYDREKLDVNRIFRYIDSLTWKDDRLILNLRRLVTGAVMHDDEHKTRIVYGYRMTLPESLVMSGMLAMGITAV